MYNQNQIPNGIPINQVQLQNGDNQNYQQQFNQNNGQYPYQNQQYQEQQYQPGLPQYQYQNNQQQQPLLPNNNLVFIPNLLLVQTPEIMFCNSPIRSTRRSNNPGIGVQGLITVLRMVLSQLPLQFGNIQIMGKGNVLSKAFLEISILSQLISSNQNINEQIIRGGKVAYCCNVLAKRARLLGFSLIITSLFTITTMIILYFVFFPQQYSDYQGKNQIQIIQICQVALTTIAFVCVVAGVLRNLPKLLQISTVLAILNQFLIIVIISVGGIVLQDDDYNYNNGPNLFIYYISIPIIIIIAIISVLTGKITSDLKRLNILLQQIPENQFSSCCV